MGGPSLRKPRSFMSGVLLLLQEQMEKIAPLDMQRCQALITIVYNEPFRIGTKEIKYTEQCANKPTHILREKFSVGHMTVCDDCLDVFKEQYGESMEQYTIEEIKETA